MFKQLKKANVIKFVVILITLTLISGCSPKNNTNNPATPNAQDENSATTSTQIGSALSTDSSTLPASKQANSQEVAKTIIYTNTQYGFNFTLPASWKGYKIVTDKWEGVASGNSQENQSNITGPIISIRHPLWTAKNPRQDIPIMIFTINQWDLLQQDKFHIGAAPIGPKELGRNSKYVFALPARYNFAFPTGYEEVDTILNNNPLQAIENK